MKNIESTPDENLYQKAIIAHFDGHISDDEYECFKEAYAPRWESIFQPVAKQQREDEIRSKPRWIRWWYKLW